MSLTYSFKTARDVLEKLRRDVQALDEQVTGDRFFNFVITAYHIMDWVKQEPSVPSNDAQSMYQNKYFALCHDLANASKHCVLRENYGNQEANSAESKQGTFGCGRFGKGIFGVGEEWIVVSCRDGVKISSLELAHGMLGVWDSFFTKHGL